MAPFLLLDGHSLAFRAYFALKDAQMVTGGGQSTEAVFGFSSMLAKLLEDHSPAGLAVAFDLHGPTFRDSIMDGYKGGRAETPEQLIEQVELIRRMVETVGVPVVDAAGFEADDVIATLATVLDAGGHDVVVVTGDRDCYQLVRDPRVRVLYNRRGVTDYVLYDEAGIKDRTGVCPDDYPFLASLRGDPSDNLPGVPGVGEKTAARLVNTYRDVESLYAHLDELTPKLRESLAASEAQVRINLKMSPLVRDVPLSLVADDLRFGRSDRAALHSLFDLLEIRGPRDRILRQLDRLEPSEPHPGDKAGASTAGASTTGASTVGASTAGDATAPTRQGPAAPPPAAARTLADRSSAIEWIGALDRTGSKVAIEPAWSGAPGRSPVEGLAMAPIQGDGELVSEVGWLPGALLGDEDVAAALGKLFGLGGGGELRVVAYRAKELMRVLEPAGIALRGLDIDAAVAAYLLDAREGRASISELAAFAAGYDDGAGVRGALPGAADRQLVLDLGPGGGARKDDEESAAGLAAAGATERVLGLAAVAPELRRELSATGVTELYESVERPLVRVLAKMEVAGIAVDSQRLEAINDSLTAEARRLEAEIRRHGGEDLNVNSTPQLRHVLFETLKLEPQKKTKTGYSTDAQSLARLRGAHPIVDALLAYREVEKLRSTYGEGLLAEVGADGRIHASFNQTVARTGRLSSDQPNLHNIPTRSALGREFREAFVARPGSALVVADYDQIELRVIADLSDDPGLVEAFREGVDIHNATAARVFGVEPKDVTTAMRAKAKMISYGLAYGMEAFGLSQRLGVGVEEAGGILEQYFAAFPNVRQYMDRSVAEARAHGYTETKLGRRRYLPELASGNFRVRQAAERQAMNSGIQGLAADIFKVALVRLDQAIEDQDLSSRIVLQVHDEIVVEAVDEEVEHVLALTASTMEHAFELKVPLAVHAAVGDSWASGKESPGEANETLTGDLSVQLEEGDDLV